jgi:Na+-transporting methylmalonyl-CoA/oxaloacetate decarboxylase gamma subunit
MVLLAVTAETWIVTGLGFGIVLALLFCLVFIIQFLGWCMQKMLAPKAPKTVKEEAKPATPAPAPKPAAAPAPAAPQSVELKKEESNG